MADAKDIMEYFPLETPRRSQEIVIREIDKAFKDGKKIILLEAPVGCGKSGIAMTFAKKYNDAHIITPRKTLQDQYYDDFSESVVLMKGRNAYPCVYHMKGQVRKQIILKVETGKIAPPAKGELSCANAPCRNKRKVANLCGAEGPCPYTVAIETAQSTPIIIHNIHSFVFQTNFSEKFEKRQLMVVDEGHEIEDALRGFISRKFELGYIPSPDDVGLIGQFSTLEQWCEYFSQDKFLPSLSELEKVKKAENPDFITNQDAYLQRVQMIRDMGQFCGDKFSVRTQPSYTTDRKHTGFEYEFIPHELGNAAANLLFAYGERVIIMSGTIYDKVQYCRYLGLNPDDVYFIRIPSSFPLDNRPIYAKPDYQVDTSHRNWNDNLEEMTEKVNKILGIFKDVKGLIHTPSYSATNDLLPYLPRDRIITHDKSDFQSKLELFYNSKGPKVFMSPVCQQGVDFKDDRARFQIILRVPYLNTSDPFVETKVQDDFPWYNYKALVVFGQQIGRVNRSEKDFGATFLLDERFNKFISKNRGKLPKWLTDAVVYK
jgi:ATP-dependent DNA helicase DinG